MLCSMRVYMEVPDEDVPQVRTAAVREGREFRGQLRWIVHVWAMQQALLEQPRQPDEEAEVA
jgi:hypothetical protein